MKLQDKLVLLRKEKGMSQQELSQALKVSRQAVSRWEVGEVKPSADKLRRLSELYGVSADDLLKEDVELPRREAAGEGSPQQPIARKHHTYKTWIAALACAMALAAAAIILVLAAQPKQEVRAMEELPADSWSTSGASSFSVGW